jgi:type II secretory pathway pseudopilin PulG
MSRNKTMRSLLNLHLPVKLHSHSARQKFAGGFTIVELLIATAVFSTILLVCTAALLQIGRVYYKGVTATQTQEVARQVIDDISRNIQFNGGNVQPTTGTLTGTDYKFCVGSKRYSYVLGNKLEAGTQPNVLVVDQPSSCDTSPPQSLSSGSLAAGSRELLSPNMRLAKLEVAGSAPIYTVTVRVIYGDNDLINADQCKGGAGSQFCATSELSTTVKKRVK